MTDDDKTRILRGRVEDEAPTRILRSSDLPNAARQSDEDVATRVLRKEELEPAAPPPSPVVAPQGAPGDRIVFLCPNGHRIVVGKQFAGKRGKCNKCGAPVQIPNSDAPSEDDPFAALTQQEEPEQTPFGIPPPEADSEQDEPSPLEGLPFGDLGTPPPSDDDADDDEMPADFNFDAAAHDDHDHDHALPPPPPLWGGGVDGFGTEAGNPTALLVAKLWSERDHGGIIELHLTGGGVLLPAWYDAKWSRGTHGLFASQAPDGSVTITAVAWDNVEKVIVRQLAAVPDDMFA